MTRRARAMAGGRSALVALFVLVGVFAGGAAAEQASQPGSGAAGLLDLGRYHSCAVLPGVSVRCWGYGADGALGYANTNAIGDDETPASAGPVELGVGRTATAISAGSVHTCALLDTADVRCWGFGGNGRLGYANTLSIGDDEVPSAAGPVDLGRGRVARAISAGRAHTCAILDDGGVRCWGFGGNGRLGYANNPPNPGPYNIGDDETPGSVDPVSLGANRTARAISTGDAHTCAVLDDGSVRCWGFAINGQLGYGSTEDIGDHETPGSIAPVKLGAGRTATAISAGDFHTCALLDNGSVRCWGYGERGRLGDARDENIGDDETPDTVAPVDLGRGRTAKAITAGSDHTCALLDDATVRCWGFGGAGALGYGNTATVGDDETPAAAGPVDLGAGRSAAAISAGTNHTCALLDDGGVRCWGSGANGELGYCARDSIGDDETPARAGPVDLGVPGVPGVGCAATPPLAVQASPAPIVPAAAGPASPGPSDVPDADRLLAQTRRAHALHACLAKVASRSTHARQRARRQPSRAERARALRAVDREELQRRKGCATRFGRTPGPVRTISAQASSSTTILLRFDATGTDGTRPPAARGYLVKQSERPIRTARDFERAHALCNGTCRFAVTKIATRIVLKVTGLRGARTYYYAVAGRDNVSGRAGPRSKTVAARTR